jgi:16S rRNA (guanine966-N2)-methyltransferase
MRIIGGTFKGRTIRVPNNLPVRPTTDFAKEGLFNILNNRIVYPETKVLDLFSGTGHISLEFASRGASDITSVDSNIKCISFQRDMAGKLGVSVNTIKADVFDFLKNKAAKYDLIFADPPYDLEEIPVIHQLVFEKGLLDKDGLLIIEHGPRTDLSGLPWFKQHRKYGNVNFSFFGGGNPDA